VSVVTDINDAPEELKAFVSEVLFPSLVEYSHHKGTFSLDRSVAFCSIVNAWSVMMLGGYFRETGVMDRGLDELRNRTEQVINEIREHHRNSLH
jgi:hypothetical protein